MMRKELEIRNLGFKFAFNDLQWLPDRHNLILSERNDKAHGQD